MLPKFLVTQLAAGPVEVGRVAAAYSVAVIVFIPAMGILVDRFGRRVFMTSGALLMAALSGAFAWVGEVGPLIYTLRAAQGLAFAMVFVAGATLAVDEAPPERIGQAIALFGLTMLAMNGVSAASVEAISTSAGWPWAFAAAAASAALCSLLSRALRDGDVAKQGGESSSLWQVLVRPSLVPSWIVVALVGAAMSAMLTYHQPFAIELGIANVSGFLVAYASAAIFARVGLGHLIDRAGRRRVAIAALCLYTLVVSAMAQLGSATGLALLGAAFGVAHGFFYPALNSLVIGGVRGGERGKVMALFQGAFNVGFGAAALGFGVLAENSGYPPVFYAGGSCALAALLLLAASPERSSGAVKEIPVGGEARESS
jgi:predicted MFS family arabinose efflux permease